MTNNEKRAALKAAGWRRSDFVGLLGERWYPPAGQRTGPLGVALVTAWRKHRAASQ